MNQRTHLPKLLGPLPAWIKPLTPGFWFLDPGASSWLMVPGSRLLVPGCWLLEDPGSCSWFQATGSWLLAPGSRLLDLNFGLAQHSHLQPCGEVNQYMGDHTLLQAELSAIASGDQQVTIQVLESLPSVNETGMEFLDSGFRLGQFWLLLSEMEWTVRWNTSLSFIFFLSVLLLQLCLRHK